MYNRLNLQDEEVLTEEHIKHIEDGILDACSKPTSPSVNGYFSGCADWPTLNTDIAHIVCYGQSLSNGSSSVACGDAAVDGAYVLGSIAQSSGTSLSPLRLTSGTQHPIATACNVLATLLHKHCNNAIDIIAGSYGAGGQSIAQLMSATRQAQIKKDEGYTYNCVSSGKYAVFEASVDAVANYANTNSRTVGCPAIVFLQGERDYYTDEGLGFDEEQPGSNSAAYAAGGDKEKYKLYMSYLKEDMQNKVMTSYGQETKPLFCIYQVSGAFVKNSDVTINMAQLEFAQENDDVILIQTPYFTPQYSDSHLSTNGYRWLGEYIGKYLFEALVNRSKPFPLMPVAFDCDANTIRVKLNKAVDGLTVDTYTVENASTAKNLYGFTVYVDGTLYVPTSLKVYGDEIILKATNGFGNIETATSAKVEYAGVDARGTGNIRDNCRYVALYNYLDDSSDKGSSGNLTINNTAKDKNGESIVGRKYPMFNWLCSFCYEIRA